MSGSRADLKHLVMMDIAAEYERLSTCSSRPNGAVVVSRHGVQIGGGFNGAPRGLDHGNELELGCRKSNGSCAWCIHGETNAIVAAGGLQGCAGGSIYTTMMPCVMCAGLIINVRLEAVYWRRPYPTGGTFDLVHTMLIDSGIKVHQVLA